MWILILVLLILAALYIYGLRHAQDIRISPYHIHVEKGSELTNLKIALIADLHLGRNMGCEMARQMVDKINALEPDVILIAGDIFDNCFDHLDDPQKLSAIFRELKSSYGVYAVYGNHDIDETLFCGFTTDFKSEKVSDPRMDAFLIDSHIELLRDEGRLVKDAFYLYGRADVDKPGRGIIARKSAQELMVGVDQKLPVIVMDHQPREMDELSEAGVDVDLCGHTHDGQVFPGSLLTKIMWRNSKGYLKVGRMHQVVTSGVGAFGPFIRIGTNAEICDITLHFKK